MAKYRRALSLSPRLSGSLKSTLGSFLPGARLQLANQVAGSVVGSVPSDCDITHDSETPVAENNDQCSSVSSRLYLVKLHFSSGVQAPSCRP
jgi:hypothetical protein